MVDISKVYLFKGLDGKEIEQIKKRIICRDYPKGAVVFTEGQQTDGLYIISSGLVKVYKLHTDGREKTLEIMKPGQHLGEMSLYGNSVRSANVETLEKTTFMVIPSTEFKTILLEIPTLSIQIIEILSTRLREANRQIQNLAFMNSRSRVVLNLIKLAEEHGMANGEEIGITVKLTHAEFAKLAGVSRETVTKVFLELQDLSLIEVLSKHIKILNIKKLYEQVM